VIEVAPAQVQALADRGILLLDVREDDEWAAGHIDGAVHLPLGQLDPAKVPESPVVLVCRSGNRSGKAARALLAIGRADVHNLTGGILAWAKSGLPLTASATPPGEDR
jgi:rhodanese-related sulfurtransferase